MTLPALVLAGRRGPRDTLAAAHGVTHRALLPVAGVPMLVRVWRALEGADRIGPISVCFDAAERLAELDELRGPIERTALRVRSCASSPSHSVARVLEEDGAPLLVTTADHALLTPRMVDAFAAEASLGDADLLVGVVARSRVERQHPTVSRTWVPVRGDSFTSANLFAFLTPRARRIAERWADAEAHRKRPWRLAASLGPSLLFGLALRSFALREGFERVSRALGAVIRPVALPFPEAALDVDDASDLALAERLLGAREAVNR